MSKPASRLGRGLSALIPARPAASNGLRGVDAAPLAHPDSQPPAHAGPEHAPIDAITPNPRQPRTRFDDAGLAELANSIRLQGILQPLLVRPLAHGRFELIAGERRWRAARLAGLATVPIIRREASEADSLELALIENLQREDLNPIERAEAYAHYMRTFGVSAESLAERLGESRPNVANYARLLLLPEEVRDLVRSGKLGMGHARALLGLPSQERQIAVGLLAVRRGLSVRQVEELASKSAEVEAAPAERPERSPLDRHVEEVERTLSTALGLPVQLQTGRKRNSGRVVIRYDSLEEFDRIAQAIGGRATLEP